MGREPKIIARKSLKVPKPLKKVKLKKNTMPEITVPKISKRERKPKEIAEKIVEETLIPKSEQKLVERVKRIEKLLELPLFLERIEGQDYFASNKGRLTNDEIMSNGLEFACTTGIIWNYRFKDILK